MEMTKKTTILFTPALHRHLVKIAEQRGTSLGDLVRKACETQYGGTSPERRRQAVRELGTLDLPVGNVDDMKRQSVPEPEDIS
jgi:hypothetical protein